MFIVGFFGGLLFLLVVDLIAEIFLKYKSQRHFTRGIKVE